MLVVSVVLVWWWLEPCFGRQAASQVHLEVPDRPRLLLWPVDDRYGQKVMLLRLMLPLLIPGGVTAWTRIAAGSRITASSWFSGRIALVTIDQRQGGRKEEEKNEGQCVDIRS
ncbi:hypothetical protein MTO96_029327 [Rhipicephalus appendiculatus]